MHARFRYDSKREVGGLLCNDLQTGAHALMTCAFPDSADGGLDLARVWPHVPDVDRVSQTSSELGPTLAKFGKLDQQRARPGQIQPNVAGRRKFGYKWPTPTCPNRARLKVGAQGAHSQADAEHERHMPEHHGALVDRRGAPEAEWHHCHLQAGCDDIPGAPPGEYSLVDSFWNATEERGRQEAS